MSMVSEIGFIIVDLKEFAPAIPWGWYQLCGFIAFCGFVAWAWIDRDLQIRHLKNTKPELELGNPKKYPSETLIRTHIVRGAWPSGGQPPPAQRIPYERHKITLCRVPVTNMRGQSAGVTVRLVDVKPPLPGGLPIMTLHRAGDNPEDKVSFQSAFPLADGETEWIDVIAIDNNPDYHCFIFSIASEDAIQELALGGQYVFTLQAFAEKSSPMTKYQVDVDAINGQISMLKL